MPDRKPSRDSVLFVTLDSCRFDTLEAADAPNLKGVGPLHCAAAPSYFTYASHSAMFVGFTPGVARLKKPILNPKFGKLFKMSGAGFPARGADVYELRGRNIIEGFARRGFATIGTGAVGWFDPGTLTGRHLTESFDEFYFPGENHSVQPQTGWALEKIDKALENQRDIFAFVNLGETHVPYYFSGADWSKEDNPCIPFQTVDRSDECRTRQRACCEFIDGVLEPLLDLFSESTILICGDHGDCWGEDGLWEHGISHPFTLAVPLIVRVRGVPV